MSENYDKLLTASERTSARLSGEPIGDNDLGLFALDAHGRVWILKERSLLFFWCLLSAERRDTP